MTLLLETPWLQQLLLAGLGLVLGLTVEVFLFRRLRRMARGTGWRWDNVILSALRGMPVVWLTAWGVWGALSLRGLPESVQVWLTRGLSVVLMGSVVVVVMRLVAGVIRSASERSEGALPSPTLVTNLAQILVAVLGGVLILQNLGIQITPLLTALGIGGLAVALALQDTLGNLFAGVQIILAKQVRTMDWVRLDTGEQGFVTDVKARNTTIRTFPDGNRLIIPNSKLASSIVKNFSLPEKTLWVTIPVGVSYASDLEEVERVALEVARDTSAAVEGRPPSEEPIFRYEGFGDSSIDFQVRIHCRDFTEQFNMRHEFVKRLHLRFNREGINIPFPIRTLDVPLEVTRRLAWGGRKEPDAGAREAPARQDP